MNDSPAPPSGGSGAQGPATPAEAIPADPTPAPGPVGQRVVMVARSGSGRVTSTARGIDCGYQCDASFSSTDTVTLTAVPDAGFSFAGWYGPCQGTGSCELAPGTSAVVAAVFARLPPLPDGCDAIVPRSVPAPVEVAFDGLPFDSASDGTGEDFLFTTGPYDYGWDRTQHLVRLRDGATTEVAARTQPYVNTVAGYSVPRRAESQPVGFDLFSDGIEDVTYDVLDPDGTIARTGSLAVPLRPGETSQLTEYVVPPSGGIATVSLVWNSSGGYVIRYGRLDAAGNASAADVDVDLGGGFLVTWGVDLAGDVLLVGARSATGRMLSLYGRWLDAAGAPLTDWFGVGDVYVRGSALVVMRDGLALQDWEAGYTAVFPSVQAHAGDVPSWLGVRSTQHLTLVRGGSAYVAVLGGGIGYDRPPYGPCAEGIEILETDGTSCGCLGIPDLLLHGRIHRVGRDGSLLTDRAVPGVVGRRTFVVYPGLFR